MQRSAIILFILLAVSGTKCQENRLLEITAGYVSTGALKDNKLSWEEIHQLSSGSFTCKEQENGDMMIQQSPQVNPARYTDRSATLKKSLKKIPIDILGFKLKGIFMDSSQPGDQYYALYVNPGVANSLLEVFYNQSIDIAGAAYYSDKAVHPFKDVGHLFSVHK